MKAVHIEIGEHEVTLQKIKGKLHISIPSGLKTIVETRNSGIPGIENDIEIDIAREVKILQLAAIAASKID